MDPRPHLLRLVGPLQPGDELMGGVRLLEVSAELGVRIHLDVDGRRLSVELAPLEEGSPSAASTQRLQLSYRGGAIEPAQGQAICRALASVIAANEAAVLQALRTEQDGTSRIREVEVARLLEPMNGAYGLSPYVGCLIGCRFCYAQSRLDPMRRLLGLSAVPWGSYADVRINAPEILQAELHELPPRPIKFCPIFSDPYHALESRHRLTRRCLEVLASAPAGFTPMLLTRSKLILRDLDVLAELPGARAGVSLPTLDAATLGDFEPRAACVDERLEILAALREAGLKTHVLVQPMLPGDVSQLADALLDLADSVSLDVLRGEEGAASLFEQPKYAAAREPSWQRRRMAQLRAALLERGVPLWDGELPPDLTEQEDA